MPFSRLLYSLAFVAATPLILGYLLYRSLRQPEYRRHWGERFALYRGAADGPIHLWVHAVSVGETRAAQPLIERLLRRYPDSKIVMTHTTPTGRAVSEELFGARIERLYLPYDLPGNMRRFIARFHPALCILMETELWPNLLAECDASHLPVVIANARLSERSLKKSLRFASLARPGVSTIAAIFAQSEFDAARFTKLGARKLSVTGNIKFDAEVPSAQLALGAQFREAIGARPVLLCASTREGEEELLLGALQKAALPVNTLVVLVPRHPQRFEAVAQVIRQHGLSLARRSAGDRIDASTRVWLGDSMGELFAYYRAADLAYVGGGLLPFGTHNLIEACAVGCPVLLGPHTFNFAEAAQDAIAAGAALRVANAEELFERAAQLLTQTEERGRMALAAAGFSATHRGAADRTLAGLAPFLGAFG